MKNPCDDQDASKAKPQRQDQVDHQKASKEARSEVAWWSEAPEEKESGTFAEQKFQYQKY